MFFIVRVVLHRIDESDDYTDLHTEMKSRGFARSIVADNGARYRLPPAEYFLESDTLTTQQVRTLAMGAVQEVMRDETAYVKRENKVPSVLVTGSNDIQWSGLTRVFLRRQS